MINDLQLKPLHPPPCRCRFSMQPQALPSEKPGDAWKLGKGPAPVILLSNTFHRISKRSQHPLLFLQKPAFHPAAAPNEANSAKQTHRLPSRASTPPWHSHAPHGKSFPSVSRPFRIRGHRLARFARNPSFSHASPHPHRRPLAPRALAGGPVAPRHRPHERSRRYLRPPLRIGLASL